MTTITEADRELATQLLMLLSDPAAFIDRMHEEEHAALMFATAREAGEAKGRADGRLELSNEIQRLLAQVTGWPGIRACGEGGKT